MAPQRYERVAAQDEDDAQSPVSAPYYPQHPRPNSPPPSFHSRASSPTARRLIQENDPMTSDADRTLADTFDSPSDSEDDDIATNEDADARQRLMGNSHTQNTNSGNHESSPRPQTVQRSTTQFPTGQTRPVVSSYIPDSMANDGVFANLSAKPQRGDDLEEKPPTYEQAAADATPPYWETTILAPGMVSDEVFVDGLPVGSVFSFAWNAMISMSFQLVGFLLTYLLHTTHAAKNGSRAGLGITLIQFGFTMKSAGSISRNDGMSDPADGTFDGAPADPNSYTFDPNAALPDGQAADSSRASALGPGLSSSDWIAYLLMILGWFILIKSANDFMKARRHEQLVLQSPDRGLSIPVIAEGEQPEHSV